MIQKSKSPLSCPDCGSDAELGTAEVLTGWAPVCVFEDDDGTRQIEHAGDTEVHWDSSDSVGLHCRNCGWGLQRYDRGLAGQGHPGFLYEDTSDLV